MEATSKHEKPRKVRFVCISDTHGHAPGEGYTLPKGDVLIHAGDLTNQGSRSELEKAARWLEKADFAVKLVVAGNHDLSLDPDYRLKHGQGWTVKPDDVEQCRALIENIPGVMYLQHKPAEVHLPGKEISFSVFGSPYSQESLKQNWAFQYSTEEVDALWRQIPSSTDVLVTHTPPAGHVDASKHWQDGGCPSLRDVLGQVNPLLHVCGHCHEGRGAEMIHWPVERHEGVSVTQLEDPGVGNKKQSLFDLTRVASNPGSSAGTAVVNASIMAKSWGQGSKAFNKPIVVDVDISGRV